MAGLTWRYVQGGRVKHALRERGVGWCGVEPSWVTPGDWYGARSDVERETLRGLPECGNCDYRLRKAAGNAR